MLSSSRNFLVAFLSIPLALSSVYAASQPVTEPPPANTCPDYGVGYYGFTGGYCLDKNKENVSYLTVTPHSARAGDLISLTLYTDEAKGYSATGTALYPPVHWNCGPSDQITCNDTAFNPIYPSLRFADPAVTGASTESQPIASLDDVPCPGTADQCQDGWLKNLDSHGHVATWTRQMKVGNAASTERDIWLVVSAGNEAEDYFAILSDIPCPFADVNKNKIDDCNITGDLKAEVQKLSKAVGKLKSSSSTKDINATKILLKSILKQISENHDNINTQDGLPFDTQVTAINNLVKKAMKVGSKTFAKDKKAATTNINNFIKALAVSRNS